MKARSQLLLFLLLAFALLFAQQGAAIHALSHLSEQLPSQSQQDKQLPHSPSCDKCVAYTGVDSTLAASGLSLALCATTPDHFQVKPAAQRLQLVHHYHSRAPPFLA